MSRVDQRVNETEKLGFDRMFIAPAKQKFNYKGIQVNAVKKIEDLVKCLFSRNCIHSLGVSSIEESGQTVQASYSCGFLLTSNFKLKQMGNSIVLQ